MKDLLDKISSYNLFNYLLPGILFVSIAKYVTSFDLTIENNFIGAFVYYFIGLTISRIGSLVLAPILRKIKYIKYSSYEDFVAASKEDEEIKLFSEVNNTYRTIMAMCMCVLLLVLCERTIIFFNLSESVIKITLIMFLFLLFIVSFRKQSKFIVDRVQIVMKTRTKN